jgi:NitT/TauT family transport system ATP-binding protein
MPVPELKVSRLSHRFNSAAADHLAIAHVDLEILAGQFVSIVGPSGSGKTTLLRCLAGLVRPTNGEIAIRGATVTSIPEDIAVVFQDYSRSLYPWFTVRRNVEFPLVRKLRSIPEQRKRAESALDAVGLRGVAERYPWQLSGGMQQRVAIARAFAYEPRLLFMDEPFASLDAQTREDLEDMLLAIKARFNSTIVFVTHDIDESVYLSDRVVVLSAAPARVLADIAVDIQRPRDQISTRRLPAFIECRSRIAAMIRSQKALFVRQSGTGPDLEIRQSHQHQ